MFFKPEASKRLQESFSFDLQYSSVPNWTTYSKLLQISQDLLVRLSHLGARDLIDVQSFIWIVFAEPYRTVDDPTVPS
jgi:hypothetical protein